MVMKTLISNIPCLNIVNLTLGKHLPPFNAECYQIEFAEEALLDRESIFEIWLVVKGRAKVKYRDSIKPVSTGDIIYFYSFQAHQLIDVGNEGITIISIWWK